MKLRITLGFLVFILGFSSYSQTTVWEEDFKIGQGWFLEENWMLDGSSLQFNWSPQIVNFDEEALSPIVHLNENVEELIITQYLDVFSGQVGDTAQICIVINNEDFVVWNYGLNDGNWGNQTGSEISFSVAEFAGQDVRFKFRAFGNDSFNWNWWQVFEMKLTAHFEYDLAVVSIGGQHSADINESALWDVDIKNLGSNSISGFTVKIFCYNSGELIGSVVETGSVASQEIKSYLFEWSATHAYNTVFYGVIESESDEFDGNNGSESYFVRISPDVEYDILFWDYDNGIATVIDPDKGDLIRPAQGITRALNNAGLEYDEYTYLPPNLNDYDIVIGTMGCYCVD